jgi:hypothetical protein
MLFCDGTVSLRNFFAEKTFSGRPEYFSSKDTRANSKSGRRKNLYRASGHKTDTYLLAC